MENDNDSKIDGRVSLSIKGVVIPKLGKALVMVSSLVDCNEREERRLSEWKNR